MKKIPFSALCGCRKRQTGVAAVELALLLPILWYGLQITANHTMRYAGN